MRRGAKYGLADCLSVNLLLLVSEIFPDANSSLISAVQGIGGGGILQLVQITISDIVTLEE